MSSNLTGAFFTAQNNGDPPVLMAVLTTPQGFHVFHAGGVTLLNLPANPVIHCSRRLLTLSPLTETLIPNVTDMFANYTSTELSSCDITLANDDQALAEFLQGGSFLGATLSIKYGYPTVVYADLFTVFTGEISSESLTGNILSLSAVATGELLRQSHITGRASRYARPKNPDDVLPIVYGAHYDLARGRGLWACPCIDTTNQYYLVADHAVLSVANGNNIKVYVNDTLVTTGYTFTPSGADENGKTIAFLTFSPALTDSDVVTCQTHGKIDSGGLLIQNPMSIIQDIITYAGGVISDFDTTSWNRELAYANSKNLMAAGILTHQSRLVQELVLEILGSFLASTWVSGQDDIKILFPRDAISQSDVSLSLSEATCSEYAVERLEANLCNSTTFDLVKHSEGGSLYPNFTPYNIDCDSTVGSQYTTTDAGDTWLLTSDMGTAGKASLWIANPATQTTTRYNYTAAAGWTCRKFFQFPDGSHKRLLWSNETLGRGTVWLLNDAYVKTSDVIITTIASGWSCRAYWHNGTVGRAIFVNTSTYETRLYALDSSDVSTGYAALGTLTGYIADQYSRPYANRIRILLNNVSDSSFRLWTLNSSEASVSIKTFSAYAGYTPRSYWHTGTDGKVIFSNTTTGIPYQRIFDANDTDIANVADTSGASAITAAKLSQSRYGVKSRGFDGGWMSSTQTPFAVMRALYNQYAQPRWIVGFTTTDARTMQLERGDLIAYSCEILLDENALPLVNQIGRILELTRDPIAGICQIKVLDTGTYLQSGGVRDRTRY